MMGRKRRNDNQELADFPDGSGSIHGVNSLIGGSGVSLDGESVQLPDGNDFDDVSSINTPNYARSSSRVVAREDSTVADDDVRAVHGATAVPVASSGAGGPNRRVGAKGGCLPPWIANAPKWLKAVIAVAALLLVAAVVLIVVAAATDSNDSGGGSVTKQSSPTDGITDVPTAGPTIALVATPAPETPAPITPAPVTPEPTPAPVTSSPTELGETQVPSTSPTPAPTLVPSASPTSAPTEQPTEVSAPMPTLGDDEMTSVTFYATAGRFQGDDLDDLVANLPRLPKDNDEFLVHLGDWNSPAATQCVEDSYIAVDSLYSTGPPTYFVVGDNEYNDCPSPTDAFGYWIQYLLEYETRHWDAGPFTVVRDEPVHPENFAFLFRRVLFVGINLPGGLIFDADEWFDRQTANMEWIMQSVEDNGSGFGALIVFAHADPDVQVNAQFYDDFLDYVAELTVPTILVHRNLGIESWGIEPNYGGIRQDFVVLVVEGATWPPMRVEIDVTNGDFSFEQETWFDEAVGPA